MGESLATFMGDLMEEEVYAEVKKQLEEGVPPEQIFGALQKGMEIIGERYQAQEYYLSELIMAADIFKKAVEPLQEKLKGRTEEALGTMVLGTVAGDIHDIGKNIVALVFTSNGFNVIDLGVDVPVQKFVEAVREHRPQLVGLSCLLTTSFESLKATVEALEQAGLREGVKVLVGGGPVDEATCRYARADAYCVDAPAGVEIAKKMLGVA